MGGVSLPAAAATRAPGCWGSSPAATAAMALKMVKGSIDRMFDKNLQDLVRGIRNHKEDEVSPAHRAAPRPTRTPTPASSWSPKP